MTLPASTALVPESEGRRVGRLRLTFEPGRSGTWLSESTSVAPVRIHRAFRSDDGDAIVQLLHVGPGLLAGDDVEIDVVVRRGASAVLVPQSAMKIHRMVARTMARQTLRIHVEPGARAEVHGALVIPFPDAEFHQRVRVDVEGDATFLSTDRWSTGRHGIDQRSGYRHLTSRIEVRHDGRPVYADALDLAGRGTDTVGGRRPPSQGLDGRGALATGVMVGTARPDRETDRDRAVGWFGERGAYLRALADDPGDLGEVIFGFGAAARRAAGLAPLSYGRYGA